MIHEIKDLNIKKFIAKNLKAFQRVSKCKFYILILVSNKILQCYKLIIILYYKLNDFIKNILYNIHI